MAGLAQVKLRGLACIDLAFVLGLADYNLRAAAEAPARGLAMSAQMGCRLIWRWRIVAADRRHGDYFDLCGPAVPPPAGSVVGLEPAR